jgi:hypothetical protein
MSGARACGCMARGPRTPELSARCEQPCAGACDRAGRPARAPGARPARAAAVAGLPLVCPLPRRRDDLGVQAVLRERGVWRERGAHGRGRVRLRGAGPLGRRAARRRGRCHWRAARPAVGRQRARWSLPWPHRPPTAAPDRGTRGGRGRKAVPGSGPRPPGRHRGARRTQQDPPRHSPALGARGAACCPAGRAPSGAGHGARPCRAAGPQSRRILMPAPFPRLLTAGPAGLACWLLAFGGRAR